MRIWLGQGTRASGRKHQNIGLHIYEDEGLNLAEVIQVVEAALRTHFPNQEITMSRSVRNALGEP